MTKRSHYITPQGEKRLRDELRFLWKKERLEVTKRVSDAAKEGDRSENAEYIYSKKRLREIDRRIRYLTKRLESIQVITQLPADRKRVYFGAWITIDCIAGTQQGKQQCYRIVGSDEFDCEVNYISIDSPMARALIGKGVDDEIELALPTEKQSWLIRKITYPGS